MTTPPAGATPHIEGKWCKDLLCRQCYSADTAKEFIYSELRNQLSAALAELERAREGLKKISNAANSTIRTNSRDVCDWISDVFDIEQAARAALKERKGCATNQTTL